MTARARKANWPAVMKAFNLALLANTQIVGFDADHTAELMSDFRMKLENDYFHPSGCDSLLEKRLDRYVRPCNYRSCASVRRYREDVSQVEDSISDMFWESSENIGEHYSTPYNFPPGFVVPIKILVEEFTERQIRTIRCAANRPK